MTENPELKIAFAEASFGSGVGPKRIRNWIDNGHVFLDADNQRPGSAKHRRFTLLDVIRLAFVARLTSFGFSAVHASDTFEKVVLKDIKENARFPKSFKMSESDTVLWALRGSELAICMQSGPESEGVLDLVFMLYRFDKCPDDKIKHWDTYLIVNIQKIVASVELRLSQMGIDVPGALVKLSHNEILSAVWKTHVEKSLKD